MPHAVRKQKIKKPRGVTQITQQADHLSLPDCKGRPFRISQHTMSLVLVILALLYALFAGLRNVNDADMRFHLPPDAT